MSDNWDVFKYKDTKVNEYDSEVKWRAEKAIGFANEKTQEGPKLLIQLNLGYLSFLAAIIIVTKPSSIAVIPIVFAVISMSISFYYYLKVLDKNINHLNYQKGIFSNGGKFIEDHFDETQKAGKFFGPETWDKINHNEANMRKDLQQEENSFRNNEVNFSKFWKVAIILFLIAIISSPLAFLDLNITNVVLCVGLP